MSRFTPIRSLTSWRTRLRPGTFTADVLAHLARTTPAFSPTPLPRPGRPPCRALKVVSFGYLHGPAPEAHLVLDVRPFTDPHLNPHLRHLTARDSAVRDAVLATPGIPPLLDAALAVVLSYTASSPTETITVAVGCAGGRHRSPVLADLLAQRARHHGLDARASHRDIDRPVVQR